MKGLVQAHHGIDVELRARLCQVSLHRRELIQVEKRFAYEPYGDYEEAKWSADGIFQIATNVVLAETALVAPEATYLAVDTVDDMDALRDELEYLKGHRSSITTAFYREDVIERPSRSRVRPRPSSGRSSSRRSNASWDQ